MAQLHSVPTLQKPTLSAQVARHLLELIQNAGLRPGDMVESEIQVCKQLQVSRGSVREAYRPLAALGMLEIGSGRRPRVHAVNSHVLAQIFGYALQTAHVNRRMWSNRGEGSKCRPRNSPREFHRSAAGFPERDWSANAFGAARRDLAPRSADIAIHATLAEASCNPLNALLLAALLRR